LAEQSSSNANLLDAIRSALQQAAELRLVIVFGSVAMQRAHPESDIDIAIDAGHRLSAEEKISIISAVAQTTGRAVDLVDLRGAGEPLLGEVLRHGKRILGDDTHYAGLIARHLLDQADFLPYRDRILAERRRAWIGT